MKVLYVAAKYDPHDLNASSGSDYQFYQAFLRMGADVKVIGPFKDAPSLLEKWEHILLHPARFEAASTE